jgi:GT2 family glycosyltransferase
LISVSAIVVTRNRPEALRACLRSIVEQTSAPDEVIVVDNGSTDDTVGVTRSCYPSAQIISLGRNIGCPAARNIGAKIATGKYLVFVDDDGRLAADALERAVAVLEADSSIGALVGAIIENGQARPRSVAVQGSHHPAFTHIAQGQGVIRRSSFVEVGEYPSEFMYGAEELDFSMRLLAAGYNILFEPTVVSFHAPEETDRPKDRDLEVHVNVLRVIVKLAPPALASLWCLKKISDICWLALKTGRVRSLAGELSRLPGLIGRSIAVRRPVPWPVWGYARYLALNDVSTRNYRELARAEYPTMSALLLSQVRSGLLSRR